MREFIKASNQAKDSIDFENNQEVLSFLKNIGSNFILKGKKFRFEAKIGWRVLAQSAPFSNWRREWDSNPRPRFRRVTA
jgi:site-specific DNA recombinase